MLVDLVNKVLYCCLVAYIALKGNTCIYDLFYQLIIKYCYFKWYFIVKKYEIIA